MNFRNILSKTSLKSSSSGKNSEYAEEITKYQSEIEHLKLTVESLKVSIESRDAAIGTLAREKEKLYVDLKSSQRSNRNLHQQLIDEREMHSKEKEYLIKEIKKISRQEHLRNLHKLEGEQSFGTLYHQLRAKDETIYKICTKYLKMKKTKNFIQRKYEKYILQNQKVFKNIIVLLQENKLVVDTVLKRFISMHKIAKDCKQFLDLLNNNTALQYENTQLKICLSAIRQFEDNDPINEVNCMDKHATEANFPKQDFRKTQRNKLIRNTLSQPHVFQLRRPKLYNFRNRKASFQLSKLFRSKSDSCICFKANSKV